MTVQPQGLGLALDVISYICLFLSWIVVALRLRMRSQNGTDGKDDALMALGLLLFTPTCISSIICTYYGLGHQGDLNASDIRLTRKYFFLIQVFWTAAVGPIRASLCVSLLRIAITNWHRIALWILIIIIFISAIITEIGVLTQARPIPAIWNPHKGKSMGPNYILWFSYFISFISILEDFAIAAMPALILKDLRRTRFEKMFLMTILALGTSAGIATIVRLRFLVYYRDVEGFYNQAPIIICMNIELAVAICAGSTAALKPLIERLWRRNSTPSVNMRTKRNSSARPEER